VKSSIEDDSKYVVNISNIDIMFQYVYNNDLDEPEVMLNLERYVDISFATHLEGYREDQNGESEYFIDTNRMQIIDCDASRLTEKD
jgi:hypothetical protein